jgi:hypothetical protein
MQGGVSHLLTNACTADHACTHARCLPMITQALLQLQDRVLDNAADMMITYCKTMNMPIHNAGATILNRALDKVAAATTVKTSSKSKQHKRKAIDSTASAAVSGEVTSKDKKKKRKRESRSEDTAKAAAAAAAAVSGSATADAAGSSTGANAEQQQQQAQQQA